MDLIDFNDADIPPRDAKPTPWTRVLRAATFALTAFACISCGGGASVQPGSGGGGGQAAPTVTSVTPANNATDVAADASVSIVFSEAMLASSITASTIQLTGPSGVVAATLTYDSPNDRVTLKPSSNLTAGTSYTVNVTTGVQSSAQVPIAAAFSSTFTTAASGGGGQTAPTVTSVTPANNASNVSPTTTVTVVFSEAMAASTITTSTVQLAAPSGAVSTSVTYNAGNNTATMTPTVALAPATAFTVTVTTGAQSASNVGMANTFSSTFTTSSGGGGGGGGAAPTVVSVAPANGSGSVAANTTVSVVFSEAMLAATINTSTVQLTGASGVVVGTVIYDPANNSATLTPGAALTAGASYTVSVTTGVQSSTQIPMAAAFSSTFTVQSSGTSGVPAQFQNLLTSYDVIPSVASALPGVYQDTGSVWVQPTFNTTVKRIGVSNAVLADHPASSSEYPFYSKEQSWSSDNQYMAVWAIDGWIQILDGGKGANGRKPYQYILSLGSGTFGCDPDPEVRWSSDPRTPHVFYHVCDTRFYVYDVDKGTDTLLVDWNVKIPGHSFVYVYGPAEGNPSTAYNAQCDCYDRYWAWGSQTTATQPGFYSVIVYDRYLDKGGVSTGNYPADNSGVIANVADSTLNVCPGGSSDIDWVSISPNGDYVLIDFGDTDSAQTSHAGCGIGVYKPDANLTWQRQLFTTDYHSDIGYDAAGNQIVVSLYDDNTSYTQHSNICMLRAARISDGQVTRMELWGNDSHGVEQNWCFGATTGPPGFHISLRGTVNQAVGLKGYALVSTYEDNTVPMATQDTHLFNMEQLVVYIPGDGSTAQAKIWRLGKTQSIRVDYNDEPHCVASPDFHRTLCGSNWRNFNSEEPVYPLVTELP